MELSRRKLSMQENRKGEIMSSTMNLTPDSLDENTIFKSAMSKNHTQKELKTVKEVKKHNPIIS